MLLHPSEHKRFEDHVQPTKLMLAKLSATRVAIPCPVTRGSPLDILREPLRELFVGIEQGRHDEM